MLPHTQVSFAGPQAAVHPLRHTRWLLQEGGQSGLRVPAQAVNLCTAWCELQVTLTSPDASLRLSLLLWKLGTQ